MDHQKLLGVLRQSRQPTASESKTFQGRFHLRKNRLNRILQRHHQRSNSPIPPIENYHRSELFGNIDTGEKLADKYDLWAKLPSRRRPK
ncbi:hypothetical protein CEE69_19180 [Rhodopirellula bahusiensis]|uniref:Uncharacterized protein n=1 Tax=Rhodopirellula bahusiensis TaxID=2014065 RepID=A0A2G1W3U0_9BACT|nr:hypothetical protein CEE69_19180 [Rhodopirellula bahusiensis]